MRAWIVIALLVVLVAAAGGAWYGLEVYPQQQFRAGLAEALATLPPGTTATYKTAHYSPLSRQAVVTGWQMHGEIPLSPPLPFDITLDSIEMEAPNLDFAGSWARALAAPAALAPDTPLPVAVAVTVKGLTVRSAIVNLTEDTAHVTNPRLYPWALLHDGMPSWTDLLATLTPRPGPPDLGDLRVVLRTEAAAVLGVAWDSHAAKAVKFTETLPGVDIEYDVHEMTGGAFDRGIARGANAEGITYNARTHVGFSIDRVAMGEIDMRQPMTKLINGEALSPAMLDGIRIGRIEYHGVTALVPGQPPIHVGAVSLGPVAFAQGLPVSGELGWTDFSVSKTQLPDPRAREAFDQLGLDTMTISFALAYNWDTARQRVSVHDTMLRINELGTVTIAADFGDIVANAAVLTSAKLVHARARFEDASLVDRMLRAGATQTGTDVAEYRRQVATLARQQGITGNDAGPALRAAGAAAGDFVTSPHSLTIELTPPAPVPLSALMATGADPANSAAMLGLAVTANQP